MDRKKYELIIFDCDGTLVDSEVLTNRVISEMLTECGIKTDTDAAYKMFAGGKFSDIQAYVDEHGTSNFEGNFETVFRKRSKLIYEQELKLIPGVASMLKKLQGVKMCIASNGPQKKMKITLPATGLDKYFPPEIVFSAYDIEMWKPAPDLFLFVCDKMGVAPNKAVVVEDTYSGAMGAVNAGIDLICYNPENHQNMLELFGRNFKTMEEIRDHLAKRV